MQLVGDRRESYKITGGARRGKRDQPFTDMKQGVSTGIRKQLVQNWHREAMGCLAGAKGPGRLKNIQTHLWREKLKTTTPPPDSEY